MNDAPREGEMIEPLIDPATGDEWGSVSWEERYVSEAVDLASDAITVSDWSQMHRSARADVLERVGSAVLDRQEEIALLETMATGKPLASTRAEVAASVGWWRYQASLLRTLRDEWLELSPSKHAQLRYEPVGLVAIVTPFNGAFSLGTWKLAPALAAGNAVVIKPPINSPASTLLLVEALREAGVPKGIVQVVQGGSEVGSRLVGHPDVSMVSFTGSSEAAATVGQATSSRLSKFVAEAGGKSAHIIFEDANLVDAVTAVVQGAFSGSGQTCVAGSRVLVQDSIRDQFVSKLLERIGRLNIGDPFSDKTHLGPIASKEQYNRILDILSAGQEEGAEVLVGGGPSISLPIELRQGFWLEPTVLRVEANSSRICQTEIFGPVISVMEFSQECDAVAIANDSPYGLAAGFWTSDPSRIRRVANSLKAGTVWVNSYRGMDWQTPFGGYKMSGLGRENGVEGLREFQELKAIVSDVDSAADPFGLA
nr:aldehyde dehydrogenase family protein [Brevibacterium luteolum]